MPTMTINGRTLHYLDEGEGFPILLGHSFLWDSTMWAPQLKVLSQQYRCLVPDLWDHGKSGHLNAEKYTLQQLSEDYWQFTQQLGLEKFSVIGLSVGGMWGAQLALDHPEAVNALVLMDTYVGAEPEETQKRYLGLLAAMKAIKGVSEELATIIAPLFFSPKVKPAMIQSLKEDLMAIPADNVPGIAVLGHMIFTRDCLLARLAEIKQPALVVVGADDIPRPPKEAKTMADLLPNGRLEIVENAGHIANVEKVDEVTALLTAFLNKYIDKLCAA